MAASLSLSLSLLPSVLLVSSFPSQRDCRNFEKFYECRPTSRSRPVENADPPRVRPSRRIIKVSLLFQRAARKKLGLIGSSLLAGPRVSPPSVIHLSKLQRSEEKFASRWYFLANLSAFYDRSKIREKKKKKTRKVKWQKAEANLTRLEDQFKRFCEI